VGLALAEISGDTPEDHGSNTVRGRTVSLDPVLVKSYKEFYVEEILYAREKT
jgi:hypothetical protein